MKRLTHLQIYKRVVETHAFKRYGITLKDMGHEDNYYQDALDNNEEPFELVLDHGDRYDLTPIARRCQQ